MARLTALWLAFSLACTSDALSAEPPAASAASPTAGPPVHDTATRTYTPRLGAGCVEIVERSDSGDRIIAVHPLPGAHALLQVSDVIYIASGQSGIAVVSIRDPERPRTVATLPLRSGAAGLERRGSSLIVRLSDGGVGAFDISAPESPRPLSLADDKRQGAGPEWPTPRRTGRALLTTGTVLLATSALPLALGIVGFAIPEPTGSCLWCGLGRIVGGIGIGIGSGMVLSGVVLVSIGLHRRATTPR